MTTSSLSTPPQDQDKKQTIYYYTPTTHTVHTEKQVPIYTIPQDEARTAMQFNIHSIEQNSTETNSKKEKAQHLHAKRVYVNTTILYPQGKFTKATSKIVGRRCSWTVVPNIPLSLPRTANHRQSKTEQNTIVTVGAKPIRRTHIHLQ